MFDVCPHCGMYSVEKEIDPAGLFAICPYCDYKQPFVRLPLFIIGGPSGAGKTTVGMYLLGKLPECVILESDILWRPEFNTPEDNYSSYRDIWLRMAMTIHQSGRSVVLVGTAIPEQFERQPRRGYFSVIHYLSLICDDDILIQRLRARPQWRASGTEAFIADMLDFNHWTKEHAATTQPPMTLLDTSGITVEETAQYIAQWVRERL